MEDSAQQVKLTTYSHCDGAKHLPAHLRNEIAAAIAAVSIKPAKGAATKIRDALIRNLRASGWAGELAVSRDSDMTITSVKGEVGLCVQTGNMARMYADLMKLQTLYLDAAIKAAAIVVPSQPVARALGDNVAQARRLERELEIFKRAYHVPTIVFALE